MIRPTEPRDTPVLLEIARGTGVFRDQEVDVLREGLDDYHEGNRDDGHVCVTFEQGGVPAGLAYYAPAPMTDRAWFLWWIIVDRSRHSQGLGGRLLRHAEDDVRARGGRLLMIETSSTAAFESPRRFYLKHGYDQAATVPDYYADGDSLVVFTRRLLPRDHAP